MRVFHPLPQRPQTAVHGGSPIGPPQPPPPHPPPPSIAPTPPGVPAHHQRRPQQDDAQHYGRGRGRGRARGRDRGGGRGERHPARDHHDGDGPSHPPSQPATDGPPDATIQGLNIRLDHPLLIEHWIAERKKRWPTRAVIEQKERDAVWRLPGSTMPSSSASTHKRKHGDAERQQAPKLNRDEDGDDASSSASSSSESSASSSSSTASSSSGEEDNDDDDEDEEEEDAKENEDKDAVDEVNEDGDVGQAATTVPPIPVQEQAKPVHQADVGEGPSQPKNVSRPQTSRPERPKPRPRPRGPPPNPFARPSSSLLHALLRREIASHTHAVLQFFRFLVLNDFLVGVERKRGDAEEALRRARLIVELGDQQDDATNASAQVEEAPAKRRRTERTKLTALSIRPLSSLAYPPAPDPLTFLDPLRALDPFPLSHEQLVAFCEDDAIRDVLAKCTLPASTITPNVTNKESDGATASTTTVPTGAPTSTRESGLTTAIRTLDALPTDSHRVAALELILHIVPDALTSTATNPTSHSAQGAVWHPPPPTSTSTGSSRHHMARRPISETDLFRLGLRVGFTEQDDIRLIAERVSVLLEKVPLHATLPPDLRRAVGLDASDAAPDGTSNNAEQSTDGTQPSASAGRRLLPPAAMGAGVYEARGVGWQQREWEHEWERREMLKRLGVRLD